MPVLQGRGDAPLPCAVPPVAVQNPADPGVAPAEPRPLYARGKLRLSLASSRRTVQATNTAARGFTRAAIAGWLFTAGAVMASLGGMSAAPATHEPRNFFTAAQEIELGRLLAVEFEAAAGRFDRSQLGKYAAALGARLAPGAKGPAIRPSFRVFADSSRHAFAFPGGAVYLSTGIVAGAENEAQLAGLLAHSLAHSALRHTTVRASRNEPFRIRAALAAAATGRSTILEAMRAIGMEPGLGGGLMSYDPASERQASQLAGRLLTAAGYDPREMEKFLALLRSSPADSFAGSHPGPEFAVLPEGAPAGAAATEGFLAGPRKFARLKARAANVHTVNNGMAALLEPKRSAEAEVPASRPIEIYRTPEFEFAYPLVWRPNRPGRGEPLVVTPQGGMYHPAGTEPRVETGMIGGSFPDFAADRPAMEALIDQLIEMRPGLIFATDRQFAPPALSPFESALFEGDSPLPNHRELVWAIATKKQESVYYLLLIAPKNAFGQLQKVFAESVRSFQVH